MKLLPMPLKVLQHDGCFNISFKVSISAPNTKNGLFLSKELKKYILNKTGIEVSINNYQDSNQIMFSMVEGFSIDEYNLTIKKDKIVIESSTESGLFYGMQTFKQLITQYKRQLPCLFIHDKPAFAYRGFYHDVTRGKIPTLKSLKELVDIASHYKLNELQLYVEHTYLFKGHSEIWNVTDPLTAEEIIELDDYCAQRHVDLVPSLSTFGHLYEALRSNSFYELNELEGVKDLPYSWVDRMNHYTLDVNNSKSIKFVENIINQFVPLFRSNKFNICADETFDLGEGKNKDIAEKIGKSKLYVDFLNEIINCVKKHDKEVMFWGDIIIKHPEHIKELPKDLICLNWWYWHYYDENKVKMIKDYGFSQYVCPGVLGWDKLMNDLQLSYHNIKMMTGYGKKYNSIGVLNTDWGDYGHWNFFANLIPGLIYGAQFSWSNTELSYYEINKAIDLLQFGLNDKSVMNILDKASQMHHFTILPLVQWFEKNQLKHMLLVTNDVEKIALDNTLLKTLSDRLLDLMADVSYNQRDYLYAYYVSLEGIIILNNMIPHLKNHILKTDLSITGFMTSKECAIALEEWILMFKKVWNKRNKPSELYRIVQFTADFCKYLREL